MRLIDADEFLKRISDDRAYSRKFISETVEDIQTVDLKELKRCVKSIILQIKRDAEYNGTDFTIGVAYSDVDYLFKCLVGVENNKLV